MSRKDARMINVQDPVMFYHALVPGICRLGDCVVLVGGVTTQIILRRKGKNTVQLEDGIRKPVATWEFIVDAYVHGVMKGDLWETRKGDREDMWVA